MEKYEVLVVGGGVAGSVAARFSAKHSFKTLLIEKSKTPRNKPCSGIQFSYFEKLIGEKVPREKLCKNQLFNIEMITPDERVIKGRMKMLNFWRSTFDSWLNSLAIDAGADFRDETRLVDFQQDKEQITAKVLGKNGENEVITRYLIVADGLFSRTRRKLRPQDFGKKASGATINYYFVGQTNLNPNTLYMFYNRDFAPLMFAWVYLKDDQWVIGTGADREPLKYAERFLNYIKVKYALRGEIVRREGFASSLKGGIYLGQGNVLITGDAAGLVDLYRGLGMDNAALSGRLAVKAIIDSQKAGCLPTESYQRFMRRIVCNMERNASKQTARYATNETLEQSLSPLKLIKGGLLMLIATQINRVLPPDRIIMLPL
jgi:flavin-dependent dehydrogenase